MTDFLFRSTFAAVPSATTWPPCSPGARAHVDEPVGAAHHLLVVLDDDHGVAEVAQPLERADQRSLSRWWRPIDGSSRM